MEEIARRYVQLAHDIERYSPGYIDGYFGPQAWKGGAERSLDELAGEAEQLATTIAAVAEPGRRTFLSAQVRAMQTSIRLLQGEPIPYREEVRALYGIEATAMPEGSFDEAIAALEALLPGEGEIAAREQAFRKQFELPAERLEGLLGEIMRELRQRTLQRFSLPEGESFAVRLVRNEPWSAYNWYLGEYRSRIDINTDLPLRLTDLPDLIAHEAYPGHHTEHAIKEQRLLREGRRGEHSILLINSPECVLSEGIATRARTIVMDDEELQGWLVEELAPQAGLQGADVERMLQIDRIKKQLRYVTGNAALLYHEGGASEEEVVAYLQRYRLARAEEARKSFSFITHPNFRSYIFTYTAGGELLDRLFELGDRQAWFARLLREPLTPGGIHQLIEQGADRQPPAED